MKRIVLVLTVVSTPAFAQLFNNPSSVNQFAQVQANAVVLDAVAGSQFAERVGVDRCLLIRRVNTAPQDFAPTKEGHELSWTKGPYAPGPNYQTYSWSLHDWSNGGLSVPKSQAWSNSDVKTAKIASDNPVTQQIASSNSSSSSSSSSSSVSSWNNGNGSTTTESKAESEVTVNGKTYRTFKHELKTTPEPVQPQSFLDGAYYCR